VFPLLLLMLAILLFSFGASSVATEIQFHVNITSTALQYLTSTNARPDILQLHGTMVDGAWNEDAFFPGYPFYLGRFYFHFSPTLSDAVLGQFATCDSVMWGISGDSCKAQTTFPLIGSTTVQDDHTWQNAIAAADTTTQGPTLLGWDHLGFVIHLLEDLTSPPHTRSSAHPCVGGIFCDPFEPDNRAASVNIPKSEYIDLSGVILPDDFFAAVRTYTLANYFSARTVFDGNGGPPIQFEDNNYFYGPCLQTSLDFGTCSVVNGQSGRKIAHKGFAYRVSGNPRNAEIDDVIAHEQFRELGPVAVEAVADFIKFYAPLITVATDSNSTGTGSISSSPGSIDCGSTCSGLFVNGVKVQLTAKPDQGFTFSGWSGDCSGTSNPLTINATKDQKCTALFAPASSVDLNPFGTTTNDGPYNVQFVNGMLNPVHATQDVNVTLLREVISQCSGLLFSSPRTVIVPQGQSAAGYNFNAGRDPQCNQFPITTRYTVQGATIQGKALDLSVVPPAQLVLAVTR
jgi:uncharacterized repeat protein (TIGR02543 family)